MADKMQAHYLASIPAPVRYDDQIPANAKLLYGEITTLCDEEGYCWETNERFANLYKVTETSISRLLSKLKERGHLDIEQTDSGRKMRPKLFVCDGQGVYKNVNPPLQKSTPPLTKKSTPIDNFVNPQEAPYKEDNIYISNTTDNNSSIDIDNKKKESKKKEKQEPEEKEEKPSLSTEQMQTLFYDWIKENFSSFDRKVKNQLWKALDDFYAPREKKAQNPQHTARGFSGLCGQLLRHCKTPDMMIDALQQATAAGWKSIYPREQPETTPQPTGSTEYF